MGYKATDAAAIRAESSSVITPSSLKERFDKSFTKVKILFEEEEPHFIEEDSVDDNLEVSSGGDEFVVEVSKVLAHRVTEDGYEYLVEFKYLEEDPEWLAEESLDCDELLEEYWSRLQRSALNEI